MEIGLPLHYLNTIMLADDTAELVRLRRWSRIDHSPLSWPRLRRTLRLKPNSSLWMWLPRHSLPWNTNNVRQNATVATMMVAFNLELVRPLIHLLQNFHCLKLSRTYFIASPFFFYRDFLTWAPMAQRSDSILWRKTRKLSNRRFIIDNFCSSSRKPS